MTSSRLKFVQVLLALLTLAALAGEAQAQPGRRARPRPAFFGPNFGARAAQAVRGGATPPDLAFVYDEANFAVVAHGLPQDSLQDSFMPIEVYQAQGLEYLGVDVLKIDWVMALAAIDNLENPTPTGAVVARFVEPYDKARVLATIRRHTKEEWPADAADSRRHTQVAPAGVSISIVFHDDKTILLGVASDIDRMLASKTSRGPLIERLRALSGEEMYAIADLTSLRGQIKALLAQAPPVPEPFEPYLEIPKHLKRVEIVSSSQKEMSVAVRLEHDTEDAAKQTARLIESSIEMGMQMLESQGIAAMTSEFKGEQAFMREPMAAYIRRLMRIAVDTVKREQAGTQVSISAEMGSQASFATTGVLVALLLPAVQSAREAARRTQASNNLKMIMLALHNYHDTHNHLPAKASVDDEGKPLLSWRVALLPYLEENELYKEFHLDEPWDSEHNKTLIEKMPAVYKCPNVDSTTSTVYLAAGGEDSILNSDKSVRFRDVTDGLSYTVVVVEANEDKAVPWTKPDDLPFDPEKPLEGLGSLRPQGFWAAMADGSVRYLSKTIDEELFRNYLTKSGGEVIEDLGQ